MSSEASHSTADILNYHIKTMATSKNMKKIQASQAEFSNVIQSINSAYESKNQPSLSIDNIQGLIHEALTSQNICESEDLYGIHIDTNQQPWEQVVCIKDYIRQLTQQNIEIAEILKQDAEEALKTQDKKDVKKQKNKDLKDKKTKKKEQEKETERVKKQEAKALKKIKDTIRKNEKTTARRESEQKARIDAADKKIAERKEKEKVTRADQKEKKTTAPLEPIKETVKILPKHTDTEETKVVKSNKKIDKKEAINMKNEKINADKKVKRAETRKLNKQKKKEKSFSPKQEVFKNKTESEKTGPTKKEILKREKEKQRAVKALQLQETNENNENFSKTLSNYINQRFFPHTTNTTPKIIELQKDGTLIEEEISSFSKEKNTTNNQELKDLNDNFLKNRYEILIEEYHVLTGLRSQIINNNIESKDIQKILIKNIKTITKTLTDEQMTQFKKSKTFQYFSQYNKKINIEKALITMTLPLFFPYNSIVIINEISKHISPRFEADTYMFLANFSSYESLYNITEKSSLLMDKHTNIISFSYFQSASLLNIQALIFQEKYQEAFDRYKMYQNDIYKTFKAMISHFYNTDNDSEKYQTLSRLSQMVNHLDNLLITHKIGVKIFLAKHSESLSPLEKKQIETDVIQYNTTLAAITDTYYKVENTLPKKISS
ncbi:hypothetical protein COB57_02730 [Candidatus Peregrinibacteria bacterium]|nr:MAG: hypothetical protein COB57_02730 [Candidatus Peregrinibacteria bacterium]